MLHEVFTIKQMRALEFLCSVYTCASVSMEKERKSGKP